MRTAIKDTFQTQEINPDQYSPLTLAYMGDCAYEIVIRTLLVHKGNAPVDKLNRKASRLAKAETQSQMITAIQEQLSEEELTMYKRGRNANVHTIAHNATVAEYRQATALEALFGWLYLNNAHERINELFNVMMEGE